MTPDRLRLDYGYYIRGKFRDSIEGGALVSIAEVRLNAGGYAMGGRYFGREADSRIFAVENEEDLIFVRAKSRKDVVDLVRHYGLRARG